MKKGKEIKINGTRYFIQCVFSYEEKMVKKRWAYGNQTWDTCYKSGDK